MLFLLHQILTDVASVCLRVGGDQVSDGRNRINKVMEVRNISGFNENTIT